MERISLIGPAARANVAFLFLGSSVFAAAEEWVPIKDTNEIRSIVTERTLVMYKTRQQYHRRDGNMVEYFPENESYTIRKWDIRDDGVVCWMIFTLPDRVIDCAAIQRGPGGALRYKWENAQGAPPLEFMETTPPALLKELDAKAGKL